MVEKLPGPMQPITIRVKDGDQTTDYSSYVVTVGRDHLEVAMPIRHRASVPVPAGTPVKVFFQDADAMFSFRSRVRELVAGDLPLLRLELPKSVRTEQRRHFVRHRVNLPMRFRVLDGPRRSDIYNYQAKTRDISGGGLRMITFGTLEIDDRLEMEIMLEGERLVATGRVVRPIGHERIGGREWDLYGVEFSAGQHRVTDAIIHYIFREQRRLRRKGLL